MNGFSSVMITNCGESNELRMVEQGSGYVGEQPGKNWRTKGLPLQSFFDRQTPTD